MKRIQCLLLALCMVLTGLGIAAAEGESAETIVAYEDLPADHRALYEAEKASALANARVRAPGQTQLQAEARGDFNGYEGSKSDNSLKVEYKVTDSMVQVGEKVNFYVTLSCSYPQMVYTVGGLAMYDDFSYKGDLFAQGDQSIALGKDVYTKPLNIAVPTEKVGVGYFNFVIVVSDGNGNQVALTTPTIQVYDGEVPNFDNIGTDQDIGLAIDNNLAVRLALNKTSTKVGEPITATTTFTTLCDPVKYEASWTLTDADGNELVVERITGEVNAQAENAILTFPYQPMKAGEVQFLITATDGDGNSVKINTPFITVEDGFYVEIAVTPTIVNVGRSVRATYQISGHECEAVDYRAYWQCFETGAEDPIESKTSVLESSSGRDTYTPRMGTEIVFFIYATCPHAVNGEIDAGYAQAEMTLAGGIHAELALTESTVKSGDTLGVSYSIEGGLAPYQAVTITGYSASGERTYQFLSQTVTETEGTIYGQPYLGREVYFVLEIIEADGYTTTWQSASIPLTGAPYATTPTLTASVNKTEFVQGETVTLSYRMSGGSGTINQQGANYVRWKTADGTVVSTKTLTGISGTADFTPESTGEFLCEVLLTDGYNQSVTWTSEAIKVSARRPGDANNDGEVDVLDAVQILKLGAGWGVSIDRSNADVDGNGSVNIYDALLILRYCAGENDALQ